ncbi:uncharacterized protein LOC131686864 [Topomyia yanbarensis]|uniref:uncharacterized protein LOC131686864 n=1 Tax=Topomyia yanbarensis TaxID=2498891 RepID=UPI00273B40EE|nr:uncharacterized protein LOC131686864 [Topomyia yanbarensis]
MPVDTSTWKLPQVGLADPLFHVPKKIYLDIGSDAFWELHTGRKISLGNGVSLVIETPFGWAVSGSASNGSTCIPRVCNLSITNKDLEVAFKFWELEAISTGPAHSPKELYSSTVKRDLTGRYVARLPRAEDPEVFLGSSRANAECRFHSLERRLQRDPAIKKSYHRFCYLPHHTVFKELSTTTKVLQDGVRIFAELQAFGRARSSARSTLNRDEISDTSHRSSCGHREDLPESIPAS